MARYIDADMIPFFGNTEYTTHRLIETVPTADVLPVVHGHWIQEEKCSPQEDDSDYYFLCSNCGHSDIHNVMVKVPFCWFCGARMDAERREE